MQRSIGIYPGTFDPVHAGHIAFALAARDIYQLDEIIFLPEPQPRAKPQASNVTHRTNMLRHMVEGHDNLTVMTLGDPYFTVQYTLPKLLQRFSKNDMMLLMGSDVAFSLPHWPDAAMLLQHMRLLIGMRAGDQIQPLEHLFHHFSHTIKQPIRPQYVTAEQAALCSTDIRLDKMAHSHDEIASYIGRHQLYK